MLHSVKRLWKMPPRDDKRDHLLVAAPWHRQAAGEDCLITRRSEIKFAVSATTRNNRLSVEETADALQIAPPTVKTRLLRARRRLQAALAPALHDALRDTFLLQVKRVRRLQSVC